MQLGLKQCFLTVLIVFSFCSFLKAQNEVLIDHPGYSVLYSPAYKAPLYVRWILSKKDLSCAVKFKRRNMNFHKDPNYPDTDMSSDYKKSGFDKGHMCPAADRACSDSSLFDTFCYTNCTMQRPGLNRIKWEQLESAVRRWVIAGHDSLVIYSGPIFSQQPQRIGVHEIAVPTAFYKIITAPETGKSVSYIMENKRCDQRLSHYATTLADVEIKAGRHFPSLERFKMQCDTSYFK